MTLPKILPCDCGANAEEWVGLYTYENGWSHVECGKCHKLGPGEGRQVDAVRNWNAERRAKTQAALASATDMLSEDDARK